MRYSSGARFSKAKPTGSFRVFHPSSRRVASHADTLREARKDATFWSKQTPNPIEIQERFPSGKWVTIQVVKPETTRKTAHATMKDGDDAQLAKRETRLPDAGAKDTKKAVTVMKAFNSKVERLLDQADAKLHHEMKGEPLDYRQFVLETKAGPAFVSPHGNWVAVRFNDPEAAAKLVGTSGLNTYSGKWNHNYFAWSLNEAVSDVARWLKRIATIAT